MGWAIDDTEDCIIQKKVSSGFRAFGLRRAGIRRTVYKRTVRSGEAKRTLFLA